HAAGIADHMRIPLLEPEELGGVEASVHTGHDRETPGRRGRKGTLREALRVASVGLENVVADRHPVSLRTLSFLKLKNAIRSEATRPGSGSALLSALAVGRRRCAPTVRARPHLAGRGAGCVAR